MYLCKFHFVFHSVGDWGLLSVFRTNTLIITPIAVHAPIHRYTDTPIAVRAPIHRLPSIHGLGLV